jgi:hypothetical protein
MGRAGAFRLSMIVLLIAAQSLSFAFAAGASSFSSRCPVHSAQVSTGQGSAHETGHVAEQVDGAMGGHAADHATAQIDSPNTSAHPTAFGVACCAAHIVGVIDFNKPLVENRWSCQLNVAGEAALMPGEIASVDPPPRSVL